MENKRRIMLVSFSVLPTMQNYMYLTYEILKREGADICTLGSSELTANVLLSEDNYLVDTSETPLPTKESRQMARVQAGKIKEIFRRVKPDIVHFVSKHTWNLKYIVWLKNDLHAQVVHTFHDPLGHKGDKMRIAVIGYNWVISRMADAVVVHSEVGKEKVKRYLKPKGRVDRVVLGCCRWLDFHQQSGTSKKVLLFGRLNKYKGLDLLPDVARRIYELDKDVKIVVTGKKANDLNDDILKTLSDCENVELHEGFVPENMLDGYYEDCDIVLIMHTSISQSGVILDAYRHSKPIVCFDIEGIHEYLAQGIDCVPAFDTEVYASKVVDLVNDEQKRSMLSEKVWQYGHDNFSERSMAAGLSLAYEGLPYKVGSPFHRSMGSIKG